MTVAFKVAAIVAATVPDWTAVVAAVKVAVFAPEVNETDAGTVTKLLLLETTGVPHCPAMPPRRRSDWDRRTRSSSFRRIRSVGPAGRTSGAGHRNASTGHGQRLCEWSLARCTGAGTDIHHGRLRDEVSRLDRFRH